MGYDLERGQDFGDRDIPDDARQRLVGMGVDPGALEAYLAAPRGDEGSRVEFVESLMAGDFLGSKGPDAPLTADNHDEQLVDDGPAAVTPYFPAETLTGEMVDLITPEHLHSLPAGTRLTSIFGRTKVVGEDFIDDDARAMTTERFTYSGVDLTQYGGSEDTEVVILGIDAEGVPKFTAYGLPHNDKLLDPDQPHGYVGPFRTE